MHIRDLVTCRDIPVISSSGTLTENVSEFLDHLQPVMNEKNKIAHKI